MYYNIHSTIAKGKKIRKTTQMPTNHRMDKVWLIHTMEFYTAMDIYMDISNIMMNERSQTQKRTTEWSNLY